MAIAFGVLQSWSAAIEISSRTASLRFPINEVQQSQFQCQAGEGRRGFENQRSKGRSRTGREGLRRKSDWEPPAFRRSLVDRRLRKELHASRLELVDGADQPHLPFGNPRLCL